MFDKAKAMGELLQRNRLRKEARLPLLSWRKEFDLMAAAHEAAQRQEEFEKVMGPLRDVIEQRILAKKRRMRGDPDWVPTGILWGGGMRFGLYVNKVMKRFYRRLRADGAATNRSA